MISYAEEFRAYVGPDYGRWEGIAIHIAARRHGEHCLIQPLDLTLSEPVDPAMTPDAPSLRIPDALGRALLEALSAHYGGVADIRQTRKDLDLERQRVDRLLDVVAGIATTAATPPVQDGSRHA